MRTIINGILTVGFCMSVVLMAWGRLLAGIVLLALVLFVSMLMNVRRVYTGAGSPSDSGAGDGWDGGCDGGGGGDGGGD